MWRQAFHGVLCWLALSQTSGEPAKSVNNLIVKDNVSADSAPRLYRNVPVGVYASAAPYAAYSFQIPAFITAPKAAASRIVPVINNANGYLRDSYGNRFVETPQSAAYKTAFPQQFLPLQELPAHLVQPLAAAASQAKQLSPHYFVGSQYRVPTYQVAPSSPAHGFTGFSQPVVYAQNLRSLAPSSVPTHTQAITAQHQPSNQAVYLSEDGNTQAVPQHHNLKQEVKFQRLEHHPTEIAHSSSGGNHHGSSGVQHGAKAHEDKAQIQAAPATITAVVNGKKTVVNIDTKPPVPLLDLSLLEPLTFANPLVPQVQHFLPRINEATYHKLPELNVNEGKKNKKEFTVVKTKSYGGNVKAKTQPKKKSKQPAVENDDAILQKPRPGKPTITVKGTPNESPEFSYEINSPNYKETYNEKSVSYNKASDGDPVTYSYDEKTQSQPITYSYTKTEQKKPVSYSIVHDSDEPAQIKHVTYQSHGQEPKTLVYTFKPEEHKQQNQHQPESEDSGSAEDSSEESDDDRQQHPQSHHHVRNQPNSQHHHHPQKYPHAPSHSHQQNQPHSYSNSYNHQSQSHHHPRSHNSNEEGHNAPGNHYSNKPKVEYHKSHHPQSTRQGNHHSHGQPHIHSHRNDGHDDAPRHNYNQGSKEVYHQDYHPHHHEEIHHRPNQNVHYGSGEQVHHKQSYASPQHRSQNIKVPVQTQYPVTQEYEEDIHIVPSEAPAANLKESSEEKEDDEHSFHPAPLSTLEQYQKFIQQQMRSQGSTAPPQLHSSAAPVVLEKAKRIIIQEESPDEMHTHQEQNIMAEMINDDGNNEEDFEKAYKNAAFGFQAYEEKADEKEKDIYNPENYGFSREYSDFDIEKTPFQEYQAEGDQFPKNTRANYKDARDSTKEDYYLDYSVNKPESMADLYQNKANYFKLYKKYKPDKYFANEHDKKKERKSEKYTVAPSFDFNPTPERKPDYFAQYRAEPIKYEYKFTKDTPRDSTAHASRPFQRLKSKTHFVEPQFQYGFEPIALPRLLDSELAAMASNDSPESEKPGMRKKIYKENWYIKKTSTSGGKPS